MCSRRGYPINSLPAGAVVRFLFLFSSMFGQKDTLTRSQEGVDAMPNRRSDLPPLFPLSSLPLRFASVSFDFFSPPIA